MLKINQYLSLPPVHPHLTWRLCAVLVLLMLSVGVALNIWRPVLLAPPWLEITGVVYSLIALAWLPALGVCVLLRPTGSRKLAQALALISLLAATVSCCFAPATPFGSLLVPQLACHQESLPQQRVRYTCVADRMLATTTYVLEGPAGWPFVWLISETTVGS